MSKKLGILKTLLITLVFFALTGCAINATSQKSDKIQVYTSIFPVYDIVAKIGGENIDVHMLVENGSDAHTFEPTTKDIINIESSELFFYNGVGMESFIKNIKNSISNRKLKFIDLSENISLISLGQESDFSKQTKDIETHKDDSEYDPHIWLSPSNVIVWTKTIYENLVSIDPENKERYLDNYKGILAKLEDLNVEYMNTLLNTKTKEILVTHRAYTYLSEAYGLTQTSISSNIENTEPSPARLIEIINHIKQNGIKYIFTDSLSSKKLAESISRETGIEILNLSTLESLSEEEIKNNSDYFSIMYKNLEALKLALG